MGWSSFPPQHKKSVIGAVFLYALVLALGAGWVLLHAETTVAEWNAATPHAVATVKTVTAAEGDDTATKPVDFASDIEMPPPGPGEGYVALIMTDIGISDADTKRAFEDLPVEVALAFSPYSPKLSDWTAKAKEAKRETLILIPMEPATYPKDDPGPQALLTRNSDAENARRLDWTLSQSNGAAGAMNFMGSSLMTDEKNMVAVFNALAKRSALFVENRQGGDSLAEEAAEQVHLPFLQTDIQIDRSVTELDVKQQLLALENLAKQKGFAVGIAQPYPITFSILKSWGATLERRGIKLVSLAALWKAKSRQAAQQLPPPQDLLQQPAPPQPQAPLPDAPPPEQPAPLLEQPAPQPQQQP